MTTSTCPHSSSSGPRASWFFSDTGDGDFGAGVDEQILRARCRSVVDLPWTLLRQVHGSDVAVVRSPGDMSGYTADAAVTATPGAVLAVRTADCAGVVLVGQAPKQSGSSNAPDVVAIGVAHAGWRGLEQGVLQNVVGAMRELGADQIRWELGPCISAAEYEFGEGDLNRLASRYGTSLKRRTRTGAPALDLRAGVVAAMGETGADQTGDTPPCTAADGRHFSWRARSDSGRQVTAIWIEPEDSPKIDRHRSTT